MKFDILAYHDGTEYKPIAEALELVLPKIFVDEATPRAKEIELTFSCKFPKNFKALMTQAVTGMDWRKFKKLTRKRGKA